jgi:CBS domain-containing protein
MQVRHILDLKGETVFTIGPDDRLMDAVEAMVAKDSGSLVVMRDDSVAGMLTFREVLAELQRRGGSLGDARVADIRLEPPVTVSPDDTVEALRQRMIDHRVRYLPVIEGGRLLGVLSFRDVARAVIQQTNFENRLLKRYIKNWPEDGDDAAAAPRPNG